METKQAVRIQTSFLNAVEKKVLVWIAERLPRWVSSDLLSAIGFVGAVIIAAGFVLSTRDINFLWLASFGLIVNWFGDSLDGTLARVRKHQRPVYGYYLDHMLDGINESLKAENDLENMTAETEVSLDYEPDKLYYNMVGAKAEWLYKLPQWDSILTEEKRKELYKAQKASTTIVKGPKVGRNDPCPCGSGKKYKKCCGR